MWGRLSSTTRQLSVLSYADDRFVFISKEAIQLDIRQFRGESRVHNHLPSSRQSFIATPQSTSAFRTTTSSSIIKLACHDASFVASSNPSARLYVDCSENLSRRHVKRDTSNTEASPSIHSQSGRPSTLIVKFFFNLLLQMAGNTLRQSNSCVAVWPALEVV